MSKKEKSEEVLGKKIDAEERFVNNLIKESTKERENQIKNNMVHQGNV